MRGCAPSACSVDCRACRGGRRPRGRKSRRLLDGLRRRGHSPHRPLRRRALRQGRLAEEAARPRRRPLRDFRNSDAKLQTRFVCGLAVVTGFKKQPDGTWGDGTVYVPDHGMSFSGYAEVLDPNQGEGERLRAVADLRLLGGVDAHHPQAALMRGAGEDDRRRQVVGGYIVAAGPPRTRRRSPHAEAHRTQRAMRS